ncbi:class I SAM-dependent methyltransferase [Verrucomicrobiales bacterium]|nr:class I SAM-dependent methyltransferase [Verrucomicrobiales bacterium]
MEFETVTEIPGNKAHQDQFDIMRTRYEWVAEFCDGKEVLELACGSGIGLGILAGKAKHVTGSDIDRKVLCHAKKHYANHNITLLEMDACNPNLQDSSMDVIICLEAVYYLPDFRSFIENAHRILRPNGILLITSVNCQWHGFNPSPYSKKYYSIEELKSKLEKNKWNAISYVSSEDNPNTIKKKIIKLIRSIAVKSGLIPKTMRGKEILKKIFYGDLLPLPPELTKNDGNIMPLYPTDPQIKIRNFKFFFIKATKEEK